jgi:polysaccharide biosynthesis protein PslH
MSKLLLITPRMIEPPVGGRALLSRLHYKCLKDILGDRLLVHELDRTPVAGAGAIARAVRGYVDGVTPEVEQAIIAQVASEGVTQVFLNGSNLGRLARSIKRSHPSVQLFTFFHNVEVRFFLGSLRAERNIRAAGVLLANFAAERMAARFSDRLIALSQRDSEGLRRLYGRPATDILPMAMEDQLAAGAQPPPPSAPQDYALFVGGAFYANQAGILWFADQVAPQVRLRTVVVGRGMEEYRARLERSGKLEVIGPVEHLDGWYRGAKVAIAPIFDGSGMKTKVAEALMFGKKIVGTKEAFSGYEHIAGEAGWCCETGEDFVAALRAAEAMALPAFDPSLRLLYERHHSFEAARSRLSQILA